MILYLYCFEDNIIYDIVFLLFWYTCSYITDTDLKLSCCSLNGLGVRVMVLNNTFNYISVISWQSVLLVEETRVPGENHWPVTSHWQTLSHNVVLGYTSPWVELELTTLVLIGTDCIGTCSCKSNYHMITNMTAPM
jgi:hypothetical protein